MGAKETRTRSSSRAAKAKKAIAVKKKAAPKNKVVAAPKRKLKAKAKAKPKLTTPRRNTVRAEVAESPAETLLPPPPPEDIIEVSGIYETVVYSEDDPFAEVREIFNHYDRDQSGTIEAEEFAEVCEALGVELQDDELEVGLSIVDADGDGTINWDEFLAWWRSR